MHDAIYMPIYTTIKKELAWIEFCTDCNKKKVGNNWGTPELIFKSEVKKFLQKYRYLEKKLTNYITFIQFPKGKEVYGISPQTTLYNFLGHPVSYKCILEILASCFREKFNLFLSLNSKLKLCQTANVRYIYVDTKLEAVLIGN